MQPGNAAKRITLSPIAADYRSPRTGRIIVRTMDFIEILPFSEIAYVEAAGNYCTFVLRDGNRIMASKTIKHFEGALSANRFLRPHQSYIVNLEYIRRVRKVPYCAICMDNDVEIPVARSRRTRVMEHITGAATC